MMTMMMDGLDDSNDFVPFFTLFFLPELRSGIGISHGMDSRFGSGLVLHGWTSGFSFFLLSRHEMLNYGSYTV